MKLPDFYITFLITVFIFSLILYGTDFNFQAMVSNHGLMPVKTEYTSLDGYEYGTHIYYVNESSVNNSHLSDRYSFNEMVYSIGDILIYSGSFLFFIYSIYIIIKYYKWRKNHIIPQHKGF